MFAELKKEKAAAIAKEQYERLGEICNEIGNFLSDLGNFDDALCEHKEEAHYCDITGDHLGKGVALRKQAECEIQLGEYQNAIKHSLKFIQVAEKHRNVLEKQRAHANMGYIYYETAVHEEVKEVKKEYLTKAKSALLKSLDICER